MIDKKINIGVFSFDFYPIIGGQGRHIHELYKRSIDDKKYNITYFSSAINGLPNSKTIFPDTANSKLKSIIFSIKLNFKINYFIQKYQLNIVHIHGGPGGLFMLRKLSVPLVYTSHHTYYQQSNYIKNQYWKKILIPFEKKSYSLANKIICVSLDTQNILMSNYNINKNKIISIPNGVNFSPNRHTKNRNTNNVLFVGRLEQRKGIDYLVNSFKVVNDKFSGATLHIVGKGVLYDKLNSFCFDNKVKAVFHGPISDEELTKLYSNVSIQVVPSIFEGFGISVLEGMSNGVAIIGTDVDGIRNIINSKHNGVLVKYGNNDELANTIVDLLQDFKYRNQLIENAFKSLKLYDWNKIYLATRKIYEEVYN
jgi:glycosyltransferase involved in cell wall biosynthesis